MVKKLTGGLAGMAKMRKVEVVRGVGRFLDPHHLEVALTTGNGQDKSGEKKVVKFDKAIIAAGSQAIKLPFMPDDPRVVDSTGALELAAIPKRMLVVGARHHRPRDGDRVLGARHAGSTSSRCSTS